MKVSELIEERLARLRRTPMSSEIKTLHVPFRRYLDGLPDLLYTYHRPDEPTGGTIGDADFILYGTGNRCLHIEMKDKETKVSLGQKERHAAFARIGVVVHVLRDLAAAIELVNAWRSTLGEAHAVSAPGLRTLVIREVVGSGDFVFEGENRLRRATIADLGSIPRA